jgi:hypothetical protein
MDDVTLAQRNVTPNMVEVFDFFQPHFHHR